MQRGSQNELDCVTTDQNPNNYLRQLTSPPSSQAGSSQARVNSMVERARIAKIPLPEAALNCPRCDSTNTKFCYFNNYSLTQPRHFCKTCRRYWTRGGALRNVPVGGGFRRNKRSKSRSKSTVVVSNDNSTTTSSFTYGSSYSNPSKFLSYGQIPGFTSNLPILPPLQSLGDYNSNNTGFGGIQMSNVISGMSPSGGILDQWRVNSSSQHAHQQFPFLINTSGSVHTSNALYPLMEGNEGLNQGDSQTRNVKEEDNHQNQDSSWNGFISNNSTGHLSF